MKIGVVYLGRRGYGNLMALEVTSELQKFTNCFAVISKQVENLYLWQQSISQVLCESTYKNPSQAILSVLFPISVYKLALQIKELKPEILLFPMFHPWNAILQSFLFEVPSIVIVHDPLPHPGFMDRIYHHLQRRSILRAQHCVLPSATFVDKLSEDSFSNKRTTVIPLPQTKYYQLNFTQNRQKSRQLIRFLFFGRITSYKGINYLLEAFNHLDQSLNANLVIAGEGNFQPYRKLLNRQKNIQIINRWIKDSEVPDLFQQETILVLPYISATQSGVIEIAASFGIPVIASRVGGIPEQIIDGETGLLVDPCDPAQLKKAMERLLLDQELRNDLGLSLQKQYAREHSLGSFATQIYDLSIDILTGVMTVDGK